MLLGDVGEIQEVGERARQRNRRFNRQSPELGGESGEIGIVTRA